MTAAGSQLSVRIDRKAYPSMTTDEPDRLAIEGLSFDAAAGEFICIVGPSGCGKTTLLRAIAGLERHPDQPGVAQHRQAGLDEGQGEGPTVFLDL